MTQKRIDPIFWIGAGTMTVLIAGLITVNLVTKASLNQPAQPTPAPSSSQPAGPALPYWYWFTIAPGLTYLFQRAQKGSHVSHDVCSSPPRHPGQTTGDMIQLIAMVYEADTAHRLIDQLMKENPGRSRQWCIEKAIADLERDRR